MSDAGILLNSHFTNELKVGGEIAWFIRDFNPSTGYYWQFTPDNSGVYEEVQEFTLPASPPEGFVGAPGAIIWQFKAVRPGNGVLLFQLFPPGRNQKPAESIYVPVHVTE